MNISQINVPYIILSMHKICDTLTRKMLREVLCRFLAVSSIESKMSWNAIFRIIYFCSGLNLTLVIIRTRTLKMKAYVVVFLLCSILISLNLSFIKCSYLIAKLTLSINKYVIVFWWSTLLYYHSLGFVTYKKINITSIIIKDTNKQIYFVTLVSEFISTILILDFRIVPTVVWYFIL